MRAAGFLLLGFLCSVPIALSADGAESLDERKAVLILDAAQSSQGAGTELGPYASAAAAAVRRAFSARGLSVAGTEHSASDPAAAVAAARRAGCRWALSLRVSAEGRRLFWRIAAYDASDSSLSAADAFSAFAGLTVLPLLDASAEKAADAWANAATRNPPVLPIRYALRFASADPGAEIRFSSGSVPDRSAGIVAEDGTLQAAYAPFMAGEKVVASARLLGHWPKTVEFVPAKDGPPARFPPLHVKTGHSLTTSAGLGRLLGAGFSYRAYSVPDSLYFRLENAAWASTSFLPGSRPVFHNETRVGLGAYPFPKPDGIVRLSVGAGVSYAATWISGADPESVPTGYDFCVEPFWYTLEFHLPRWALVLEHRFPFSVGLDSGYLPRGWLSVGGGDGGAPFVSVGVMRKW